MEKQRWSYKGWGVSLMWDEEYQGYYCRAVKGTTQYVTDYRTEQLDAIDAIVSMINKG